MLNLRNLNTKTFIILLAVILGIFSIYLIFYFIKTTPEPLPAPEEPKIEDIQVLFIQALKTPSGYDVVARIKNPNELWGAPELEYTLSLLDSKGKLIAKRKGTSFIGPQEEKYLMELMIQVQDNTLSAEVEINNKGWKEFEGYKKPKISVIDKHYKPDKIDIVWGIIRNDSPYGFVRVGINVVVFDKKQNITGVSHTFVGNILTRKERYFEVQLMKKISNISKIEVEPEVNAMEPGNYIKDYGEPSGYEERETGR